MIEQPRQHEAQRRGIFHPGLRSRLGRGAGLKESIGEPGMLTMQVFAQNQRVHDREHAALLVIGAFDRMKIRKQPYDVFTASESGASAPISASMSPRASMALSVSPAPIGRMLSGRDGRKLVASPPATPGLFTPPSNQLTVLRSTP